MKFFNNYSLKTHNTFGVEALASVYAEYDSDDEIIDYIRTHDDKFNQVKHLIIGEGSNLLFTGDYYGLVLHPKTKKISIVNEDNDFIYIEASAGVIWDDFVDWTIKHNAFGLENLSLIPGTVGASAVQNIGAYGAEAGCFIQSVKFVNLYSGEVLDIPNQECAFSYRNSIFKNDLKESALILSVTFRLNKNENVNIEYADLKKYFQETTNINASQVRIAIIEIRNNKLPDPKLIGNAGSFFKNPVVDKAKFEKLLIDFSDLKYFVLDDGNYKLAAGWLIDKCGLKGFEHNGAAVHENQALVIINKSGTITGKDIVELSDKIKLKVFENFEVNLEPEVIFI